MIAEGFVTNGVKTYISARKAEACDATAARLSEIGECISIPTDLSTADGIASLVDEIKTHEDKLNILVNNAGSVWGAPIEEFPEAAWDKVMTINVKSPFFLTQALLPLLESGASAEDPARIIMVGSIDGLNVSQMPTFSYGPSKAAIHHLARTLAAHLADRNITANANANANANAIAPGLFPSKMTAATIDALKQQAADLQSRLDASEAAAAELADENTSLHNRQAQYQNSLPLRWVGGAVLAFLAGGFLLGLWWVDHRSRKRHGGIRIY